MTAGRFRYAALAILSALASCEEVEQVQDRFRDLTPHEQYQASLARVGLSETALGRDWLSAARHSVETAVPISLPFEEEGFITPESPTAMAYRVSVPRGQRLTADVTLSTEEGTRVFIDLFRVPEHESDPPRPVLSTDSVPGHFVHEPWRGGDFILRVQPELLRGGRFNVVIQLEAQLAFPVHGHDIEAIQSVFGMPRDGGARQHEGIDIFADRGTPAIAAVDGVVNRVRVTSLGGKVVWLRDRLRNANLYYAHLDSQLVVSGQEVKMGDTLGFVGNTGNARTTPPHLHFGVYRRGEGAVDPFPFVSPPSGSFAVLTADLARLGQWVRVSTEGTRLRAAPTGSADVLREMEQYTPLRVMGGSGDYFRVRLPDGDRGYVAARLTETLDAPLSDEVASVASLVRLRPEPASPIVTELDAGDHIPVLGRYQGYLFVRAPGGLTGWLGLALQD
jgi:murein DD-endopeptidase MepM/ murein hydrolase activator NlpD